MADTKTKPKTQAKPAPMADPSTKGREMARVPPQQRQRMTVAQERGAKRDALVDAVEQSRGEISKFLKAFDIDFDFFAAGVRLAMMQTMKNQPAFFDEVTPESFLEAVFRAAKDGLVCDGKEAGIGQFKGVATYMPMRNGFVKVLWRTGLIESINDNIVTRKEYDNGWFEYEEGDAGFIRHRKDLDRTDKDEVVAAYCVITLKDARYPLIEIVPKADLEKIAKTAKSQEARGAWALEMHRKAAIRRIMKRVPQERAVTQLLQHDEENYDPRLAAPTSDKPAVPRESLFDDKAAVRREAAVEQSPQAQPEPEVEAEPEVRTSPPAVIDAVSAIMHAKSLGELATAIHDAQSKPELAIDNLHADDAEWLNGTIRAQQERLRAAQENGQEEVAHPEQDPNGPPALVAVISSQVGEKAYEDQAVWQGDILNKMASVSGAKLKAFWRANRDFVHRAKTAGYTIAADRILKVATDRGVEYTEGSNA